MCKKRGRHGSVFEFFHEVSIADRNLVLGGRFIDANFTADAVKEVDVALGNEESRLPLALLPWGVHVNHSTMNINDPTLRFSFGEFGDLLYKAEEPGKSLKSVIAGAVHERRA